MKALTICQPYADMIAKLEKPVENRLWATAYRGPLAIHAGKSRTWLEAGDEGERLGMVYGAVVAIATLVDCVRFEHLSPPLSEHHEAVGPWCWILTAIEAFRLPIPCRGARGLWEWVDLDCGIHRRQTTTRLFEAPTRATPCPHCSWPTIGELFCSRCRRRLCLSCSDVEPVRRGCSA